MPRYTETSLITYDFAAWRGRCGLTKTQAQKQLGVSKTQYWRMEKSSICVRRDAWACYGIERYIMEEQAKK